MRQAPMLQKSRDLNKWTNLVGVGNLTLLRGCGTRVFHVRYDDSLFLSAMRALPWSSVATLRLSSCADCPLFTVSLVHHPPA